MRSRRSCAQGTRGSSGKRGRGAWRGRAASLLLRPARCSHRSALDRGGAPSAARDCAGALVHRPPVTTSGRPGPSDARPARRIAEPRPARVVAGSARSGAASARRRTRRHARLGCAELVPLPRHRAVERGVPRRRCVARAGPARSSPRDSSRPGARGRRAHAVRRRPPALRPLARARHLRSRLPLPPLAHADPHRHRLPHLPRAPPARPHRSPPDGCAQPFRPDADGALDPPPRPRRRPRLGRAPVHARLLTGGDGSWGDRGGGPGPTPPRL